MRLGDRAQRRVVADHRPQIHVQLAGTDAAQQVVQAVALLGHQDHHAAPLTGVRHPPVGAGVELLGVVGGRVRERAREVGGIALEDVIERTAGEVVLVEGEHGRSALV